MKKTKRIIAAMLVLLLAAGSFAGCGKKKDSSDDSSTTGKTTTEASEKDTTEGQKTEEQETEEQTEEETYDYGGTVVKCLNGDFSEMNSDDPEKASFVAAKEFVEEKYNIKLELASLDEADGYNTTDLIIQSIASGDPVAHLVATDRMALIKLASNNALSDVNAAVEKLNIGSRYKNQGKWGGKYYGFSDYEVGRTWVMAYDRNLFEEIGMEKTPTQMFMEGKWDYASFKEYCIELKSKLPDGMYPIANYPYHWGLMGSGANGMPLVDENGKLNYMTDEVIEAVSFYQELLNEGLAPQPTKTEEGKNKWDYSFLSDTVAMGRVEDWQLEGITHENWGIVPWPWGSAVTCDGDYTTLSDNYQMSYATGGVLTVLTGASEATGIPEDVLMQILFDFYDQRRDLSYMVEGYEAEQKDGANAMYGQDLGEPRTFCTEEDIEMFDWIMSRARLDNSWALTDAELIDCWTPFANIFAKNLDVRSELESFYNEGVKNLEDFGVPQK